MKNGKLFLRFLAVGGFFAASYLIVSALQASSVRSSIYGLTAPFLIFFNLLIILGWLVFETPGLWTFIFFSSTLILFVGLSTNAVYLHYQIPVFFAIGLFATIFKNSMVSLGLSIDRKRQMAEEEFNTLMVQFAHMQNANDSLKEKIIRYAVLKDFTAKLNCTLSLDDAVNTVIAKTFELLAKADLCILFLVEDDTQELALRVARGRTGQVSVKSKQGDIFDQFVLKQRQALIVFDTEKDFRFNLDLIPMEIKREFRSLIITPLISNRKVVGIIRVESRDPESYMSDDLRLLAVISDLAAVAIDNAGLYHRIEELAIRDGLTGLYCCRYFKTRIAEDIVKASRIKQPLSLLMVDIDNFKSYNDKYGHIAGDIVLKGISEELQGCLELGDLAARYGGEEFVVILFGKDKTAARNAAEVIRKKAEAREFVLRDSSTHITVSIGCAAFPDDSVSGEELIRFADSALYIAKKEGRNRVCLSR